MPRPERCVTHASLDGDVTSSPCREGRLKELDFSRLARYDVLECQGRQGTSEGDVGVEAYASRFPGDSSEQLRGRPGCNGRFQVYGIVREGAIMVWDFRSLAAEGEEGEVASCIPTRLYCTMP